MQAYISEIYSSVQGEGLYTGQRQIFVRFAGCPLRCDYCDTPDSLVATGHGRKTEVEVLAEVDALRKKDGIDIVSLTGGEPLVNTEFLKAFLPLLKNQQYRVYLETAGVHPEPLMDLLPYIDVIAMDIKLPSATGQIFWLEHEAFLKVAHEKLFVKIVIEKQSTLLELGEALRLLQALDPPPSLVLQPVTPLYNHVSAPSAEQMASFYEKAISQVPWVLVMPQQHRVWGVR